jgi:predicted ATPase
MKLKSSDGKSWVELESNLYSSFKISHNLNIPTFVSETESPISEYTSKIVDDVKYVFSDLKYLGPLRSAPKKFYSSETNNYQKGQGKHNLGLAMASADKSINQSINKYFESFDIPYTIDAKDLGDVNTGPLISLQLTDTRNNAVITPKDVGFGIGQVLPIIFEAVISNKKHICVEQPEIHLHPRLQAHLADLFIDSVQSRKNQWIVETHSEALMLRIQRRIREGKIPKEMVSVLYVDVGESGAQVTQINLDDDGDFTTVWPEGFFEERLEEIFGV